MGMVCSRDSRLVSIIVPVHNAAGTLRAAAESALSQTYDDVELILVDDGGMDGSPALCDELAGTDRRVRVLHMEDRGVSAARNRGIEAAGGGWIAFLDADDVLHPDMIRILLGVLERTAADYAGCGFEKRRDGEPPFAGEPVKGDAGEPLSAQQSSQQLSRQMGQTQLRGGDIILCGTLDAQHPDSRVWSKLFRREYIGEHRFREGLTIGEDMLFLVELAQKDTRYVRIRTQMYSYYLNPHGAMERPFTASQMDLLRCRALAEQVIRDKFPALSADADGAARLAAQQLIAAVLTASKIAKLPAPQQEQYRQEYEQCRDRIREQHPVKGAAWYLPKGYRCKIWMLLYLPGIYRRIYGKWTRAGQRPHG